MVSFTSLTLSRACASSSSFWSSRQQRQLRQQRRQRRQRVFAKRKDVDDARRRWCSSSHAADPFFVWKHEKGTAMAPFCSVGVSLRWKKHFEQRIAAASSSTTTTTTTTTAMDEDGNKPLSATSTIAALGELLGEDPASALEREIDERGARQYEREQRRKTRKTWFEKFQTCEKEAEVYVSAQSVFLDCLVRLKGEEDVRGGRRATSFFELAPAKNAKREEDKTEAVFERDDDDDNDEKVFQIPIIPYDYVVLPGARARLNLFEPRWLTLFSKLLAAPPPSENKFLMRSASQNNLSIDIATMQLTKEYESKECHPNNSIVPGYGRISEDGFIGTKTFGALYLDDASGKLAGVGVQMETEAHDVMENQNGEKMLAVYTKASSKRFKVLRVAQTEPYVIVDAVPYADYDVVVGASEEDVVLGEAKAKVWKNLKEYSERHYSSDYDAVRLSESEELIRNKIIRDEFSLGNVLLYDKPDVSLQILTSKSRKERAALVSNVANQVCSSERKMTGGGGGLLSENRMIRVVSNLTSFLAAGSALSLMNYALRSMLMKY